MPSYKLVYFNAKGRAEPSRYMFAQAGVEYEDKRLTPEEWKELKPTLLHGQLPVLEVDGKCLIQSHAIHHYLAEELGFSPKTAWDRAQVEVVLETGRDMSPSISAIFAEKDEAMKAELKTKFETETVPKAIGNLEKILKANNDGKDWFVGNELSLADVMVFNMFYDFVPTLLGKKPGEYRPGGFPLFASFMEKFHNLPGIKKWIEARPVTNM
ncbi:Hematopoietic prostaglandin D synthase [Holothuria leucospilota]|uniref:glutathione transferase n=1 Tax=Holothuria leucospilota TaxID=206669 RepID=A0A9Q0YH61_HOLLE|nr:Hematopoietic prostaglandin D synthase [Holothuria leucospilota]